METMIYFTGQLVVFLTLMCLVALLLWGLISIAKLACGYDD